MARPRSTVRIRPAPPSSPATDNPQRRPAVSVNHCVPERVRRNAFRDTGALESSYLAESSSQLNGRSCARIASAQHDSGHRLSLVVAIRHRERLVQDRQAFLCFGLGHRARRHDTQPVVVGDWTASAGTGPVAPAPTGPAPAGTWPAPDVSAGVVSAGACSSVVHMAGSPTTAGRRVRICDRFYRRPLTFCRP